MRKIDDKFLRVAAIEAQRGEFRYKHGVVIARNKDIVTKGHNRSLGLNNTLVRFGVYFSLHAELDAIMRLPYNFDAPCTLYSFRDGGKLAKPCAKCLQVISRTSITRVVFSVEPGYVAEMFV